MSKRFPTAAPAQPAKPSQQPAPAPRPRKKGKSSVQFEAEPDPNGKQNTSAPMAKSEHAQKPGDDQNKTGKSEEPESASAKAKSPPPKEAMPDLKRSTSGSGEADFDLRPSKPGPRSKPVEVLFDRLLSEGYLSTITSDPVLLGRFTAFLSKYKPDAFDLVKQYIEMQKVVKAVHYANAVAATLANGDEEKKKAAEISSTFLESSQAAFDTMLTSALPAWVTYSLVKTATSCLTAEISNQATPLTQDLVGGLSEVFCITDPRQQENPIVYASAEFYRLTGYDKDSVIDRNCRFLQGPRTKVESVQRLKDAISKGEGICETLLNYRRDGRPFVNVLMLAPLHDDKGKLKYYLGAQVDASKLIEGGRGIDGLERFLLREEMRRERGRDVRTDEKHEALAKLRELSMTFDLEESAVVQSHSRSNSRSGDQDREGSVGSSGSRSSRRRLDDDEEQSGSDDEEEKDNPAWNLSRDKPSGGLPGMYKKYVLIRPFPSLRTIFVSQAVRKLGKLQQRPFLAHLAAPAKILTGLKESFQAGSSVTAKVMIMAEAGKKRDGTIITRWPKDGKVHVRGDDEPATQAKTCWISATPLQDGNDKIGVWMVVIVDQTSVASNTGQQAALRKKEEQKLEDVNEPNAIEQQEAQNSDLPIKPKRVDSPDMAAQPDSNAGASEGDEGVDTMQHVGESESTPREPQEEQDAMEEQDAGPEQDAGDEGATNGDVEPQANTERSESLHVPEDSGREVDVDADNAPTESRNGLPVHEVVDEQNGDEEYSSKADTLAAGESVTPTEEEQRDLEGASPQSKKKPGIIGMDYLTSRTLAHRRQVSGEEVKQDQNEPDWPFRSPYSID